MTWLVSAIVTAILSWLASKGISWEQQRVSDKQIDQDAQDKVEAMKDAKTDDEFDAASHNS